MGCNVVSPSNSDDHIEFGDPYEIRATDPTTGEPIGPDIDQSQLSVVVSYGGGCAVHAFELSSSVLSGTASVWLTHEANGDPCDAYLTEELKFELPECLLSADVVQLLDPNGAPIIVPQSRRSPNPMP